MDRDELTGLTMGRLLELYPSAALTLFARFGIGSRDKSGFRPEQLFKEVLARYLVFDLEKVHATVRDTHLSQLDLQLSPEELGDEPWRWIDARGRDEFELCSPPGSSFLDADLVRSLKPNEPILFYCWRGPFAAAAAQHFRARGFQRVRALAGGLRGWGESGLPHYGSDAQDSPQRLRIMPLRTRARLLCPQSVPAGLRLLGDQPIAGARLWRQRHYLYFERAQPRDWPGFAREIADWLAAGEWSRWGWREEPLHLEEDKLRQVLAGPVQERLNSHKGKVELVKLEDEVAWLELAGGCLGCSSSAITVSEEIAETLMEAFPGLLGVVDASDHSAQGLAPHH